MKKEETYFSDLSLEELENLCHKANNELIRRREQEREKDWNNVVTVLKDYIKKYGEIKMHCDGAGDCYLDSAISFSEIGNIHHVVYYY